MHKGLTALVLLLTVAFALPACGLKGDLYLEETAEKTDGTATNNRGALDAGLNDGDSVMGSGMEQTDVIDEAFGDDIAGEPPVDDVNSDLPEATAE